MPNPNRRQTHQAESRASDLLAQFTKHLPPIGGEDRQIKAEIAAPSDAERELSEALASRMLALSVPNKLAS